MGHPPNPNPNPNPPQPKGGVWPGNETTGLPTGLGNSPLKLGNLLGLSPGTQCGDFDIDLGACNGGLEGNAFTEPGLGDTVKKSWSIFDAIKKWVDRGLCAYYAYLCQKTIKDNVDGANVNQDPMQILIQAEQCQAQGRTDCSDPEWNNIQQSGIQQDQNCQKAAECALNLTQPQ